MAYLPQRDARACRKVLARPQSLCALGIERLPSKSLSQRRCGALRFPYGGGKINRAQEGRRRDRRSRDQRWHQVLPRYPARCGSRRAQQQGHKDIADHGPERVRARVGLRPTRPQHDAGMRIEPTSVVGVRERNNTRGHGRRRSARGTARRMIHIQGLRARPYSWARSAATGRIRHVGLTERDEAGRFEPCH